MKSTPATARLRRWTLPLLLCALGTVTHAAPTATASPVTTEAMRQIGRTATPAEVKAWDIDVRPDFVGLPKGSGSVSRGEGIWEEKCASCHGVFGESNEVFTPIAGGTTQKDIETGRVANLAKNDYPQRTTLMKVSTVSTLWDYINRAMPWNAPKSLTPDEVYAVLAYILNLGEIVPADFTLSDQNIAQVQARMPNRNGKVFYRDMWGTHGKGDVKNPLCMKDCVLEHPSVTSSLPDFARNTHGNLAEQARSFGPARGTDTSQPPRAQKVGLAVPAAVAAVAATTVKPAAATTAAAATGPDVQQLLKANACTACHGVNNKIVGPSFRDVAKKYQGRADGVDYLTGKIRQGGQGVWGSVPMPPQAQLKEADARAMAKWLADGAR